MFRITQRLLKSSLPTPASADVYFLLLLYFSHIPFEWEAKKRKEKAKRLFCRKDERRTEDAQDENEKENEMKSKESFFKEVVN